MLQGFLIVFFHVIGRGRGRGRGRSVIFSARGPAALSDYIIYRLHKYCVDKLHDSDAETLNWPTTTTDAVPSLL
jgi:hypothetical protein